MTWHMHHNARDQASCSHLPASVLCDSFDDSERWKNLVQVGGVGGCWSKAGRLCQLLLLLLLQPVSDEGQLVMREPPAKSSMKQQHTSQATPHRTTSPVCNTH